MHHELQLVATKIRPLQSQRFLFSLFLFPFSFCLLPFPLPTRFLHNSDIIRTGFGYNSAVCVWVAYDIRIICVLYRERIGGEWKDYSVRVLYNCMTFKKLKNYLSKLRSKTAFYWLLHFGQIYKGQFKFNRFYRRFKTNNLKANVVNSHWSESDPGRERKPQTRLNNDIVNLLNQSH